ncbi:MAG TPA: NAD-binding protein [Candidatus Dormibacteraeota bacterium]
MRVALAGVGRMGSAIAGRLRAAGHRVALYDPALPAGESEPSLAAAASRSVITFLCLPDAVAVEASLPGLREAAPPTVIDLTSSLPATTRRMASALAPLGVDFLDCPLSGGVAGARAGTLTAMVGGDPALVERARPVLSAFASNVRWAGPLGAGHATKALNNALSAVSLMGTAELLVTAVAHGHREAAVIEAFNAGPARSQNSEVKYPRDVLTRTYGAGFTAALLDKDLATALRIAAGRSAPAPFLSGVLDAWREATRAMGADADFTRFHAVVEARAGVRPGVVGESRRYPPTQRSDVLGDAYAVDTGGAGVVDVLCRALATVNLLAAIEVMRVARAEGLDRERVLSIVNTSTGRSEATRSELSGEVDLAGLAGALELARGAGVWAPVTSLALALTRLDEAGRAGQPSPFDTESRLC